MANVYYYEVAGLEPLKQISIQAKTEKQANRKIARAKVDGRNIPSWKLVKTELDNK